MLTPSLPWYRTEYIGHSSLFQSQAIQLWNILVDYVELLIFKLKTRIFADHSVDCTFYH
jgi:hypothetical protein